jgi:hypothetical protein
METAIVIITVVVIVAFWSILTNARDFAVSEMELQKDRQTLRHGREYGKMQTKAEDTEIGNSKSFNKLMAQKAKAISAE